MTEIRCFSMIFSTYCLEGCNAIKSRSHFMLEPAGMKDKYVNMDKNLLLNAIIIGVHITDLVINRCRVDIYVCPVSLYSSGHQK